MKHNLILTILIKTKFVYFKTCLISLLIFTTWLPTQAQDSLATGSNSFWMTMRIGQGSADMSEFQAWCASQGVSDVTRTSKNNSIGFDLLYNHRRMVYGLSSDFEIPSLLTTEPYYFSFALRAGYTLTKTHPSLSLKALAGVGMGFAFVRFQRELPQSLRTIAANYDDPFARAGLFIGRLELLGSYQLKSKPRQKLHPINPVFFVNASVSPTLHHGNWHFGETVQDIDGNTFNGQRVDMPAFYKANWYIGAGLGMVINSAR